MDAYRPSTAGDGISSTGGRVSHSQSHGQGVGGAQETGNHFRRRSGSGAGPSQRERGSRIQQRAIRLAPSKEKRDGRRGGCPTLCYFFGQNTGGDGSILSAICDELAQYFRSRAGKTTPIWRGIFGCHRAIL